MDTESKIPTTEDEKAKLYDVDPGLKIFVSWLAGMDIDYFSLSSEDQVKFRNTYELSRTDAFWIPDGVRSFITNLFTSNKRKKKTE